MRIIVGVVVLALAGCGGEGPPQGDAGSTAAAPAAERQAAAGAMPVQASALMAIPDDPQALKRLEAMGYTIHKEEGHLHAPGVKGCPAMADGPVM